MKRKPLLKTVVAGLLVVSLSACGGGTRVSDERIEAAGNTRVVGGTDTSGQPASDAVGQVPVGATDTGTVATAPGAPGTAGSVAPGSSAAGGNTAQGQAPAGSNKPSGGSPAAGTGSQQGSVPAVGGPCTQQLAPIVLGQVGVFSGLVGQSTGNMKLGVSLWLKSVNAAGGIACHPVQVYQVDDGSDPTKTAAATQDLIESKKVVAFVGANVPVTIAAFRSVIDRYKIPVLGGDSIGQEWVQDQYLFPQGASPYAVAIGSIISAAKVANVTKIGSVYCVEATACSQFNQSVTDKAGLAKAGLTLVAQQTASLTQTDYTSVCQNMKNAGAQAVSVALDSASLSRFARSCAGIGFTVPISVAAIAVSSGLVNDANLNKVGLYIGSSVVPYMETSTPALQAFHSALAKFAPGQNADGPTMLGWTAGLLFQKSVEALGTAARSGPVTTAAVFDGVYKLKGETLNNLTSPLTFSRGKPAPPVNCYWAFRLFGGTFNAPFGLKKFCI